MDYSDLLNSVVNEQDNIEGSIQGAKQIVANKLEAVSGILSDVGTPGLLGTTTVGAAFGYGPKELVSAIKAKISPDMNLSKGYTTAKDAVDAGRVGELETSQKLATSTEEDIGAANSQLEEGAEKVAMYNPDQLADLGLDAETGLTSAESDSAAAAAKAAGSTLSEGASAIEDGGAGGLLAGDETLATGLDVTGVLAPVGVALGIFGFLGSTIAAAVESFEGHHETDPTAVPLDQLTSVAFDPSHT
jgi:hypothetical protein